MFTIDLLKGKGLPRKSRPVVMALAAIPFVIPLLGTLALAACWQHNNIMLNTRKSLIEENQKKTAGLSENLEQYKKIADQIAAAKLQIRDINAALRYRIQITNAIAELACNLPDSLALVKMELSRVENRSRLTDGDTGANKYVFTIQRILRLRVGGPIAADTDSETELYVQKLRESAAMKNLFTTIQIAGRSNDQMDGSDCSFYEIECVLKEQS